MHLRAQAGSRDIYYLDYASRARSLDRSMKSTGRESATQYSMDYVLYFFAVISAVAFDVSLMVRDIEK